MLKLIFIIAFIIATSFDLFPQWSNDPNNNLVISTGWDPHIVSDSVGGCYITYNYGSFYPQKLAVERLDRYGYKPWTDRKQILGELPEQWQAQIIEDGEGGVIVSYDDNQVVGTDFTSRVRVQKVDSDGNFLWGQTGTRVNTEETNHGQGGLVSDGDGGCVIVWQNYDERIFMNRIDRFGQRLWGETGIFLINTGTSINIIRASDGKYYVQINRNLYRIGEKGDVVRRDSVTLGNIIPDTEGGLILSGKAGNINNITLVSQRKDSLGNNLWQEPYVEIANNLFLNSQLSIRYNNNYYFGWTSNKNGIETQPHIQGLRGDGTELFINGGIPLSNTSTTITSYIPIVPSDNLSNIYIWTQWINQPSSTGNFASRIDTNSTQVWGDSAVLLNTPALRYLGLTTDCLGGAIGTGYLNEDFAIRVFKVSADGKLGEVITGNENYIEDIIPKQTSLYQNYPNPFNSSTIIKYQIPKEGRVKIYLYNILGEKILTLFEGEQKSGDHEIKFNSNGLPSGNYFYSLETDSHREVKKLTILK